MVYYVIICKQTNNIEGEVLSMEGLDFSKIIIVLDYYIRKIMSLLDSLLAMVGSTPEGDTDAE